MKMDMKKTAAIALALSLSAPCLAEVAADGKKTADDGKKRGAIEEFYGKRFGGYIRKPGTGTGATGFVIVGGAIDEAEVVAVKKTIGQQLKHEQKVLRVDALVGLPSRELVASNGIDVGVFVVADGDLPPMLVSPEDRWALVNVAKLRKGLKDDVVGRRLYAARCRGEMQRAFCYVSGCGSSQFDGNLMDITEIEQIDALNPDLTVGDTMALCRKYLSSIKITQPVMVTYSRACKEGWAPAPTNEYQKAIWEKVHQLPTEPIKIKPEAKKVKE